MIRTALDGYKYDLKTFRIAKKARMFPSTCKIFPKEQPPVERKIYERMLAGGCVVDSLMRYPFDVMKPGEVLWVPRVFLKSVGKSLMYFLKHRNPPEYASNPPFPTVKRFELRSGYPLVGVWRVA